MAGPACTSHAAMPRTGDSTGFTGKAPYKQVLAKSSPVAIKSRTPASSSNGSPTINAHRQTCLNHEHEMVPRTSRRGRALQLLEEVGELLVGTGLSSEDKAALSAFTQRLAQTGATNDKNVAAHVAQAVLHLKAALELSLHQAESGVAVTSSVAAYDDCKAALTAPMSSESDDMLDDDLCKARYTQRIFGDAVSSSGAQSEPYDEELKERMSDRSFGRDHPSSSFNSRSDVDELEKNQFEFSQRLFGRETPLPEVAHDRDEYENYKLDLTQRLFGTQPLPEEDPRIDEYEECKLELTQRLFGRDHPCSSFNGGEEIDEMDENKMELSQRLFGRDHVSNSFDGGDMAMIAAVKGAQSSLSLESVASSGKRWAALF